MTRKNMEEHVHHVEHPDMYHPESSKIGMWLFIFTELLLFAGLFIVYSVYRYKNPIAFNLAAEELSTFFGTLNTVILLISSMTVAMSITAIQKGDRRFTMILLTITILLALAFLVNKNSSQT